MTAPNNPSYCHYYRPSAHPPQLTGVVHDAALKEAGFVRLHLGLRGLAKPAAHRDPDAFLMLFADAADGQGAQAWELGWSTEPARKTTDPVFQGACVG